MEGTWDLSTCDRPEHCDRPRSRLHCPTIEPRERHDDTDTGMGMDMDMGMDKDTDGAPWLSRHLPIDSGRRRRTCERLYLGAQRVMQRERRCDALISRSAVMEIGALFTRR